MIEATAIQAAAARHGFQVPEEIDPDRKMRAENFAARVMTCLMNVNIPDRREAYLVLVAAAYDADAEIVSRSCIGKRPGQRCGGARNCARRAL